MKNIAKIVVLFCLIACMLLSVVSCNVSFEPIETTTGNETTDEKNPGESPEEDLYKLEMQTVFEMAKAAGYTGTLEDLIAMFKGEAGTAGKDGVTPHIGNNGNWWVGDTDLGVSAQGIQGPQGDPGRGLLKMELVNGELIVYYTDGTSQNLGPITNGNPDTPDVESMSYIIKVTDTSGNPIAGVELKLGFNGSYASLPATAANGYTLSDAIAPQNYTIHVIKADGYEFNVETAYQFLPNSNVAYIILAPTSVTPPADDGSDTPDKIDMNGYVYKAYVRDYAGDEHQAQVNNGNNDYRCIDFWVDQADSENDAISYAVYHRNQQIEKDYNCKIRQISSDGSQIEHLIAAYVNGDRYDLTIILAKVAAQAATQNLLRNLKGSQYMDLSNPALDQKSIQELSVGDKLYFLSGDMNISTMDVAGLSIVNLEFYEDLSDTFVEEFGNVAYYDIYNTVWSKTWTMETMLMMARIANIDCDTSDGSLSVLDKGDCVGYYQYLYSSLWYFYGSGGRITTKDESGLPEFAIQTQKAKNLYDYIFDRFNRKYSMPWAPKGGTATLNAEFLTGDVLFTDCTLFNVRTEIYPAAQFEYGILPIPTYEEGMDYQSVVYFNNWAHLWAIPSLCGNQEYDERMMQIMAVYSGMQDSTMDAYYTRTICFQAAMNNGSRQVMNIIRNSLVYDIALLYPEWGNIETKLIQIPDVNYSEYATMVESVATSAKEQMNATIEKLLDPLGDL